MYIYEQVNPMPIEMALEEEQGKFSKHARFMIQKQIHGTSCLQWTQEDAYLGPVFIELKDTARCLFGACVY